MDKTPKNNQALPGETLIATQPIHLGDVKRRIAEYGYQADAAARNGERPTWKYALGLGKVTMEDVMREDAESMNREYDKAKAQEAAGQEDNQGAPSSAPHETYTPPPVDASIPSLHPLAPRQHS